MSYASEVLADSPSSYFALDETSGTTMANQATPANTGALTGAAAPARAGLRPGNPRCLDLGPTSGFMAWTDGTNMAGDWTVEYWAAFDSISIFNPPISKLLNAGNFAFLNFLERQEILSPPPSSGDWTVGKIEWGSLSGARVFAAQRKGAAYEAYYPAFAPRAGVPYHIALANQSNVLTVYVNAHVIGAYVPPTWSSSSANNSGSWRLGTTADSFWGNPDLGISDVAIYPSALSASRIAAHYAARAA